MPKLFGLKFKIDDDVMAQHKMRGEGELFIRRCIVEKLSTDLTLLNDIVSNAALKIDRDYNYNAFAISVTIGVEDLSSATPITPTERSYFNKTALQIDMEVTYGSSNRNKV